MSQQSRVIPLTLLVSLLFLSGCAANELAQEMDQLYRHLPSEMVWVDGMLQTWGEKWKVGYRGRQFNQNITELVRPPETVENWTELLTLGTEYRTSKVYTYPGGATFTEVPDPVVAMEVFRMVMQERCAKQIAFQRLDEDRTSAYPSVIFFISCERFTKGVNLDLPEAQVHRMFQGRHAFYHTHRTRHASTLDQATLDRWVQGLRALYVCDNNVPGQECEKKKHLQ
jgi:hypothetical protein